LLKQLKFANAMRDDSDLPADSSADTCPCGYTDTVGLPCCHMFAYRKSEGNSFSIDGIWPHWMKWTLLAHCQMQCSVNDSGPQSATSVRQQGHALTTMDKFQRCRRIGQALTSLACEGGTELFTIRMAALKDYNTSGSTMELPS